MGRKLLVKTLYPKGIVVDREKILYRTQNQNLFIEYIQDMTGYNGQTKKWNSELKFNYSALVDINNKSSKYEIALNCKTLNIDKTSKPNLNLNVYSVPATSEINV
jgi:hypothetical protein